MCTDLRSAAVAGNVKRSAAAEDVAVSFVQRERLHDKVILQLITPSQIPYTFALPREVPGVHRRRHGDATPGDAEHLDPVLEGR